MKNRSEKALTRYIGFWLSFIVAVQVLFILWLVNANSGDDCDGLYGAVLSGCKDAETILNAAAKGVVLGIWIFVDIILLVVWLWKDPIQRNCPTCGGRGKVQNEKMKCRICGHEWQQVFSWKLF